MDARKKTIKAVRGYSRSYGRHNGVFRRNKSKMKTLYIFILDLLLKSLCMPVTRSDQFFIS